MTEGPTVPELLAAAAAARPTDPYCEGATGRLSIGDLEHQVGAVAAILSTVGVRAGHRVAVLLPNHPDHIALIFALGRLRATWVAVNPRLRGDSLRHLLLDSRPDFVVAPAEQVPLFVVAAGADLSPVLVGWTDRGFAPVTGSAEPPPPPGEEGNEGGERVAVLIYTSGTTGSPKGVQVTDRMWQAAARGAVIVAAPTAGDRLLLWEPFCHIGGAQVLLLPLLERVVLAMVDGFHASTFWDDARRHQVTHIHHLGGILQILSGKPPDARDREHRVRISWGGGCDPDTWRKVEARFGFRVRECYGMTETSSIITVNDRGPNHGVGRPLPGFEIDVLDEGGRPVAPGESGEIVVGDHGAGLLTPGYFRRPEATAAARRDGRWWTGDRGRWDVDGCLQFLGRAGDNIRRRGENVSAEHVERIVAEHPAVAEAAVVGVASDLAEQEILLFVVPSDSAAPPDLVALVDWCRSRLADYEVPRYVRIIAALPKTPSERIAKGSLPRSVEGAYDAAVTRPAR
jgi:crotonobetaine/carnitine-CoA ligase